MANFQNVITKADQVDLFTTNVRNLVANATVWYTGSPNLPPNMVGFPTSYLMPKDPGGPTTGDIAVPVIQATVIANALQDWCYKYTRVRKFRFNRTGNLDPYDSTQITDLDDSHAQPASLADIQSSAPASNIIAGQLVVASNFNNFINTMYLKWDAYKNNTETYTYNYCHSSCHSNCHSSLRIRR